ncbi:helix-turn-helix transcriptional regulator [Streptomyces violascens]|uniref:helix-turn-helix transcriptional regulator n=1 Tax=Streptomyces violascens TaxID=67381 RepID=UPI0036B07402
MGQESMPVEAPELDGPGFLRGPAGPVRQLGGDQRVGLGGAGLVEGRLAREELVLARRWGSPCTVAASLRALGLLRSGSAAVDALREAAELLEPTPATLDLATVLTDLGERLHESGRADEARDSLRRALDLAAAAEARPLAARAHRALRATGARPRRARQSDVPALTDRERHVATLAAAGMTNDMIATELFITRRTVEFHLTRAYRKLGVTSRTELTAADLPLPRQRIPREPRPTGRSTPLRRARPAPPDTAIATRQGMSATFRTGTGPRTEDETRPAGRPTQWVQAASIWGRSGR